MQKKFDGEVFVNFFMLPLHRMILETVVYYDVFDYPLTEFEVWKLLLSSDGEGEKMKSVSLREVMEMLEGSFLRKRLGRARGFVFLYGRDHLVALRIRRQKYADREIRAARWVARVLSFLPFVRMAGITGSLAMKNAERGSDWDFFIVLRAGHIWMGRAVATAALHLLGLRRYGRNVSHRACLNFWVTDHSLEIPLRDIFSSNEYLFLIPLFDDGVFAEFQDENRWMRRFRPHFEPSRLPHFFRVSDTRFSFGMRRFLERIFSNKRLEDFLRNIQKKKIDSNPKTNLPGAIIEATDDRLIFLPHPRGPQVYESFLRRMSDVETAVM